MRTAAASNRAILAMLALAAVIALALPFAADTAGIVPAPRDRVIAVIDDIEVTQADWDRAAEEASVNERVTVAALEILRDLDVDLPERWRRDWMAALDDQREEVAGTPLDVRLLVGLISRYAFEADFRARGLHPTDAEVKTQVDEYRRLREQAGSMDGPPGELARVQYDAQIEAYGEDRFWGEIMPESARRNLALSSLFRELDLRADDVGRFLNERPLEAEVRLTEHFPGNATVEDARHELRRNIERLAELAELAERSQP